MEHTPQEPNQSHQSPEVVIRQLITDGQYQNAVSRCRQELKVISDSDGNYVDGKPNKAQIVRRAANIRLLQASAHSKLKEWSLVAQLLREMPSDFVSESVDAQLLTGLSALASNQVAAAVRAFEAVVRKDPNQPLARTSLLAIHRQVRKNSAKHDTTDNATGSVHAVGAEHTPRPAPARRDAPGAKNGNGARTPVMIISGFLGAGKTTFLNHILRNKDGLRVAVIVNDMASLNVDAELVSEAIKRQTSENCEETEVVELTNGCICCTLRDDLGRQIAELTVNARGKGVHRRLDYILVESTGISEPLPVAQIFLLPLQFRQEDSHDTAHDNEHSHSHGSVNTHHGAHASAKTLNDIAFIDAMVSVVDATNFWKDFASGDRLLDRHMETTPTDTRSIVDLLTVQVEYANIVVINKCDLVPAAKVDELEAFLLRLNPSAKCVRATFSNVALATVLHTGLFNFDDVAHAPGWLQDLVGDHESETDAFGFTSFVFRSRRPFLAQKFHNLVSGVDRPGAPNNTSVRSAHVFRGVLRSKGSFSIAEEPSTKWMWSSSFSSRSIRRGDIGIANAAQKQPGFLSEIVFIGIKMNEDLIRAALKSAEATDSDLQAYEQLQKPLPHPWMQQKKGK